MEKIAIITGGNRGIGLGLAKTYHKNGYRVFSIARSQIEKMYAFEQYPCDLSSTKQLHYSFKMVFSQLDKNNTDSITLINNAGRLGEVNTTENLRPEDIENTIQLNLTAPLQLTSLFLKYTENWKCKKKILNISSGAAINPYESWSMYCASKAGLDMVTKVVSKEQKDKAHPASVVSIYPGVVDTDMQAEVRNAPEENFKAVQRFKDFHKNNELSSPDEVATKIFELDQTGFLKNGLILDIRTIYQVLLKIKTRLLWNRFSFL